jgi:hypothetical protein
MEWGPLLLEQLTWHWERHSRPHLDGLTDDEYRWEPVPGMWSVRTGPDGSRSIDFAYPEPSPAPVTTIAWRLAHVIIGVFGQRTASHFGGPPMSYDTTLPVDAADALRMLDETYARWVAGVEGLDEAALARPVGPAEGPFAELPYAALVLHISREAIHHLGEVLLLRDLYRARPEPTSGS